MHILPPQPLTPRSKQGPAEGALDEALLAPGQGEHPGQPGVSGGRGSGGHLGEGDVGEGGRSLPKTETSRDVWEREVPWVPNTLRNLGCGGGGGRLSPRAAPALHPRTPALPHLRHPLAPEEPRIHSILPHRVQLVLHLDRRQRHPELPAQRVPDRLPPRPVGLVELEEPLLLPPAPPVDPRRVLLVLERVELDGGEPERDADLVLVQALALEPLVLLAELPVLLVGLADPGLHRGARETGGGRGC